MRVVNNKKAQAKTYIRNDLKSNVTNLSHEKNELQDTIAILCNLVSGSLVGIDQELIGYCQKTRQELDRAIQQLNMAAGLLDQLDITEEVTDNEYY